MADLAVALSVVIGTWPAPYSPPERAELAKAERADFVPRVGLALASAAGEATCSGPGNADGCRRKWPGPPAEIAVLAATLGYFESRLDARIQGGGCDVWGPRPRDRECDGALFPNGIRPPGMPGLSKRTKWGLVVFKASSMFQFQGLSDQRISEVVGLDDEHLLEASRQAVRTLCGFRSMCRAGSWETCVVSAYAGTIHYSAAPVRVAFFRKALARVRAELAG